MRILPPLTPELGCCNGSAYSGPENCTCWTPIYDVEQRPQNLEARRQERAEMCPDCACRPDSVERVAHNAGEYPPTLIEWSEVKSRVHSGTIFYCHQGMRREIGERHPCGRVRMYEHGDHNYQPPMATNRKLGMRESYPLKADGTPADICAGWAALRRKHLAGETPDAC